MRAVTQIGGGHTLKMASTGCTHLSIAVHNAGDTNVDGYLARIAEYRDAVAGIIQPVR